MKQIIGLIRRSERGASLIETALVLPLLLLLLLVGGIVDFGFAFNNYIMVTNAAREGARYAAKFPFHEDGIYAAAKNEATNFGVNLGNEHILIEDEGLVSGKPITVTVTFPYEPLLLGAVIESPVNVRSRTVMIIFDLD